MRQPRFPRPAVLAVVLLTALAGGCARYEYDIIDPPDLAGHIGGKQDVVFSTDAVEYRMLSVNSRLVMRLTNTGEEPVTLSGERSVAVDPNGLSHPLYTQTIAPGSFIELGLPPPVRVIEQTAGPSFYWGYGGAYRYGSYRPKYPYYRDRGDRYRHGGGRYYGGRYAYYDPFYYDAYAWPRTYRVYDTSDPAYWSWEGEGQVRLTLFYELPGRGIEDRFVIARRKL